MIYYREHAEEYFEASVNADMHRSCERFLSHVKKGGRILDIGSASGRDLKYFLSRGYSAEGLEPSVELIELSHRLGDFAVYNDTIQHFGPKEPYDALWACASLLHLSKREILDFYKNIDRYLVKNGVVFASGKNGFPTGTAPDGRFFTEFTEELVRAVLNENEELTVVDMWYSEDELGRTDFCWLNFILRNGQ